MLKKLLTLVIAFFVMTTYAFAQAGSISGTVTDGETGEVLPGANVFIQQLQRGASTDAEGTFLIEDVPAGTYTVRVSFVGYQEYTQQVDVGNTRLNLDIALQPSQVGLDELVVVGYGTTSRRNLTGSVSQVSSESLDEVHLTTFESGLQGKTAGVQVTSTSGVLGAPVSVRVRGTSSLNASSQPLYVVDGIPLTDAGGEIGAGFGGQGVNPFINLNPQNIESIQVLKSATASAIYGARGSNGVVLIETKSGVEGETQINVNFSAGFTEPTEEYDILNGPQFQEMASYSLTQTFGTDFGLSGIDDIPNSDWADLVTRTGSIQKYNASVSGGTDKTQFRVAGTYQNEEGFARPNFLEKFDVFAKVNHQPSDKLSVGLTLNPSRSENNRVATSNAVAAPYTFAALEAPIIPARLDDGTLNDGVADGGPINGFFSAFAGTPLSNAIGDEFVSTVGQVNSNAFAEYNFTQNLSFRTEFSVQYLQIFEDSKTADFSTDGFPNGSAFSSNNQFLNYTTNNILTYTNDWEDHSLNAVLGVTWQHEESDFFFSSGSNFANNDLKKLDSAGEITNGGGSGTSYAFQNNLTRINYTFKDRYLFTFTASYNGSSRFAEDERYGFFPAGSAAWILTEEDFLNDVDWLSFLKLKAGVGVTGNSEIGNFNAPALLGSVSYNAQPGLKLTQLPKPSLGWEETTQIDAGLEYAFLDNRIRGEIGYFNKLTTDLLLSNPISATNGFTGFLENNGEIRNTGFEFDVQADIISTADMNWSINANISTINNEVESLPGGERIFGENLVREGEPLGAFFVVPYEGVDPDNGDALFRDIDGNLTNNFSLEDRRIMGDPFPDFFGGFGTSFAYKGLSAQVNFQYSQGNDLYWADGEFLRTNLGSLFNQDVSQLDYWTPENTDATVPEPRMFLGNGTQGTSSRYLKDGSYLRLKSATLSYTLPTEWVRGNDVRVYAQGTNLLTFTDFPGLDPEQTSASDANATQGNVFFQPPQQRTILFGVELGL